MSAATLRLISRTPASIVRPPSAALGCHSGAAAAAVRRNSSAANNSAFSELSDAHRSLFDAKQEKGMSFDQVGKAIGRDEVWTAALFYGQAKGTRDDLDKLSATLDVPRETLERAMGAAYFPERSLGDIPPRDPLLYRLYEIVAVYGYPLKSILHEKFGDGIVSAIDFQASVEKIKDEKTGADRAKITLNGKWLPYSKW